MSRAWEYINPEDEDDYYDYLLNDLGAENLINDKKFDEYIEKHHTSGGNATCNAYHLFDARKNFWRNVRNEYIKDAYEEFLQTTKPLILEKLEYFAQNIQNLNNARENKEIIKIRENENKYGYDYRRRETKDVLYEIEDIKIWIELLSKEYPFDNVDAIKEIRNKIEYLPEQIARVFGFPNSEESKEAGIVKESKNFSVMVDQKIVSIKTALESHNVDNSYKYLNFDTNNGVIGYDMMDEIKRMREEYKNKK